MEEKFGTVTNSRLPELESTRPEGEEPTVALEAKVSVPSEPTEYDSTSFDPWFATYRKPPPESITMAEGADPAIVVRGSTSLNAPEELSI
jgi:hypothetical protein